MSRRFSVLAVGILIVSGAVFLRAQAQPASRWWAHVSYLADDRMKGRETGSPEHREAAEYIARQFKEAGLKPAAPTATSSRCSFRSRKIVESKSRPGARSRTTVVPVVLGDEADLQHADRAGAARRGADGVCRIRPSGAGGEARRPGRTRCEGQGRAAADRRPIRRFQVRCLRTTRTRAGRT